MSTEAIETGANEGAYGFTESIRAAIQGLRESANVENVYGEPIVTEGKTIVPIARVAYGFGGGFGSGPEMDEEAGERGGEGGGGGGGVMARPVGVLEVTERETRFVRFTDWKRLALALDVGIVLGYLLARWRRR